MVTKTAATMRLQAPKIGPGGPQQLTRSSSAMVLVWMVWWNAQTLVVYERVCATASRPRMVCASCFVAACQHHQTDLL